MVSPTISEAITEHSMCHPGRPLPHGDGQEGSPGLEAFQRAKSSGDRLLLCTVRAPVTGHRQQTAQK